MKHYDLCRRRIQKIAPLDFFYRVLRGGRQGGGGCVPGIQFSYVRTCAGDHSVLVKVSITGTVLIKVICNKAMGKLRFTQRFGCVMKT